MTWVYVLFISSVIVSISQCGGLKTKMFSTIAFYPEHNVDLNNHERITVMPANVLSTVILQSVEKC